MKKKNLMKIFPIVAFVLSGCMNIPQIPYVITMPQCHVGSLDENYKISGIHFTMYNNSSKQIKNFSCKCMIFDTEGNNPFIGSNCIISKFDEVISSNNERQVIINLDPYLNYVPDAPFVVDNFYISKIVYSDGSVWKDTFGTFLQGGL